MSSSNHDLRELYKYVDRETKNPTIKKIFFDDDYYLVNFNPSYQRNYVWSIEKATKLIETILINGEIPPITVTKIDNVIEIIDGRQRYESILNFCNNKFRLKKSGLSILTDLEGCTYKSLPDNAKDIIQGYKIRMIVYSFKFGVQYSKDCVENLKRDLFRRYNSGITSLSKAEIARASYAYDTLTKMFENRIKEDEELYTNFVNIFIPKTKRNLISRELINLELVNIRELLTTPYIPIINCKTVKFGADVIDEYYQRYILRNKYDETIQKFENIIRKIIKIKENFDFSKNLIVNNILFFKAVYWMLSVLYEYFPKEYYNFSEDKFTHYIELKTDTKDYFDNYRNMTTECIKNRYIFMKDYLNKELNISIDKYIDYLNQEKINFKRKPKKVIKNTKNWKILNNAQDILSKETTFAVSDINDRVNKGKFFIRPFYQREEIKNVQIASKIIESITLGIKLPPIYVCSRINEDGVTIYEVIDGQQRIISVLSYIGSFINDCDGNLIRSKKNKFKLKDLRNSEFINNLSFDQLTPSIKDKIMNYEFDCIEIKENVNTNFKPVDMFLRLNSKPYPILYNSFEMWNSFDCIEILDKIKLLSKKYSKDIFRQGTKKMKNEELITTLAYLNYKKINLDNITDVFKVYIYFKDNEIKITFDKKYAVTTLLDNIEKNKNEKEKLIASIDEIEVFIEKIKLLFDENYNKLGEIINPYKKGEKKVRAKDFYILFLIIQELNYHIIKTYKQDILKDIYNMYCFMKKTPDYIQPDDFIKYTKNLLCKYSKLQ